MGGECFVVGGGVDDYWRFDVSVVGGGDECVEVEIVREVGGGDEIGDSVFSEC